MTGALGIGPYLDDRIRGAGNGALDQQQVAVGVDRGDFKAALSAAFVAHLTRHPHPFEDARGEGAGADRTRGAHVVRTVGDRTGGEVVFLDPALEALADRDPRDFHLLAGLEALDRDVVTDLRAILG